VIASVILPRDPLLLPPLLHFLLRSSVDILYPFEPGVWPEPAELPFVMPIQSALSEGRFTATTANCISKAATMTIFPSTQDVSGLLFSSRSGIKRQHAMMTELLPNAITLSTAILRRMDIWRFQTVEIGRMRM
jgi:hypothetical protein